MGRLADKNILISGGNSGIGLAAAQEFFVNAGYSEFLLFEEVTEQSFDKVKPSMSKGLIHRATQIRR